MIDLDIVDILRKAADEYEALIKRNRQLDLDIIELRKKYNEDVSKIRATPSPVFVQPERNKRILDEIAKATQSGKAKIVQPPPPEMKIEAIGGLSKRASQALKKLDVWRVRHLKHLTLASLAKLKNCGPTTISEIKGLADRCGYTLK